MHFFIMGYRGHWQAALTWPPPTADKTLELFLGLAGSGAKNGHAASEGMVTIGEDAAQHGMLIDRQQQAACRWTHHVSKDKHFKVWE